MADETLSQADCDAPRRIGSHTLGEFPLDVVRVDCPRCDRAGSYRRDSLTVRFGAEIALPDLLMALASCDRRKDFSHPCGARFTDLAATIGEPH